MNNAMTPAERQRKYRLKKKGDTPKKVAMTSTERSRKCRLKKKEKIELLKTQIEID